ncbi:MAG: Aminomethyltransferase (glycine cleavage system T protein) [uncultured Solirubrobacteraceae bacterium]|uniref:Aminomethyltransferase n=1 Tax=uncultured Solirubrobacteraceae bacterium TaxID=1162706 RepID=A0A6J4RII1_9ACTN|nr:MAG: Aminomethyltransferase (glycine cleavage system T protein) [uncultured Solirubrobacteraceae bacterium]
MTTPTLKRTPLFAAHVAADAKLVPFTGWEMPVQYATGIRREHDAVRDRVGVFDVSHMGEIEVCGPDAEPFLQHVYSNDVERLAVGGAQYALICNEDGGMLDDVFTYRLAPERYLTVTNAANHDRDVAWLRSHAGGFDVEIVDAADRYAMLAVQGPRARELVQAIADKPLPERMQADTRIILGREALVCGTGYTGEDGVELLLDPDDAPAVWDELLRRGATPCGLAARDTLRLEVNYHLYGNDLSADRNPIEAGLGWACAERTGFIGSRAIAAARADGTAQKLVAFKIDGPGIARQGNLVVGGGEVTSGTMSPSLGVAIGMAYLPSERAAVGETFEIDVRGKRRSAVVASRPLYSKESDG